MDVNFADRSTYCQVPIGVHNKEAALAATYARAKSLKPRVVPSVFGFHVLKRKIIQRVGSGKYFLVNWSLDRSEKTIS
jgi:hypothetical protein